MLSFLIEDRAYNADLESTSIAQHRGLSVPACTTAARIAASSVAVDEVAWLSLAFMYVAVDGMYTPRAEDVGIVEPSV